MFKIFTLLLLFIPSLYSIENSFNSFGYFRVQSLFDSDKQAICFKGSGAGSKYRLGNECETWGEIAVSHEIKSDNDIVIHNEIMPVFYAKNDEKIEC